MERQHNRQIQTNTMLCNVSPMVIVFMTFLLFASLPLSAYAEPITPKQAVSEMAWGVNLSTLYMADKIYEQGEGNNIGYSDKAPMGIGIWFWDNSFDWLVYDGLHDDTINASVQIPYTSDYTNVAWFDGMFELGVFLTDVADMRATIALQDTKIITADGTVYPLNIDGVYVAEDFGEYNDYGFTNCQLHVDASKLPDPSPEFAGAVLQTTVKLLDIPYSSTGKVDYFFEYQRHKVDQYELTNAYLDQGVNVFRLPVTWTEFVKNEPPFTIDREWLDAIKTEVDYILSRGAYCILNMHDDYLTRSYVGDHWETAWMLDEYSDYVYARFQAVWEQIAEYFKDYPSMLIFETANEPTMDWTTLTTEHPELSMHEFAQLQNRRNNELNAIMVDTIRSSGGRNIDRLICLSVGNYNTVQQLDFLEIPDDDYLIVQLHSYSEMEENGRYDPPDYSFDYETRIDDFFEAATDFTERTGIPILIGEVGVTHKLDEQTRRERLTYYYEKCLENNMPALWWEDYYHTDDGYCYWLYDQENQSWGDSGILESIQNVYSQDPGAPLASPTLSLNDNQEEIPLGDKLDVILTELDAEATMVYGYLVASDNRTAWFEYEMIQEDGKTILRFDTKDMPLGSYRVVVCAQAEGRVPGYSSSRFSIIPNGTLTAPLLLNFPVVTTVNEALKSSFTPVEHAQWYNVRLSYCGENRGGGEQLIYSYDIDAQDETATQLSFESSMLSQHGIYRLWIYAGADNQYGAETEKYFRTIDPADQTIVLMIDGENGTPQYRSAQEDYCVQVIAPGAVAVRILDAWQNWSYWTSNDLNDKGLLRWWQASDEGKYCYVAQAAYDEGFNPNDTNTDDFNWESLNWSAVSNEVRVYVEAAGVSDAADFTVPYSVNRGELLPVMINGGGNLGSPTRSTRFRVHYVNEWGDGYGDWLDTGWVDEFPVTVYLPTGQETAETLRVCVEASALGYDLNISKASEVRLNQVESGFVFSVQENILTGTNFSISAWCPNAAWITLCVKGSDGETVHWGDYHASFINNVWLQVFNPGIYEFYAIAHFEDESGQETRTMESRHFSRSIGYRGELIEPVVLFPSLLPVEMGLTFAVRGLDQSGLDYWQVQVADTEEEWLTIAEWTSNDTVRIPKSFEVNDLSGNRHYVISVYVDGGGCPSIYREYTIVAENSGILHLPAQLQTIGKEAFAAINATTAVIPEGVTEIADHAFDQCNLKSIYVPTTLTHIGESAFNEGAILYGIAGSEAEKYAAEHDIPFVIRNP